MFKNPFSFSGRIRRLEYGLSYFIYTLLYFMVITLFGEFPGGRFMIIFLVIFLNWFLLAQGAKRCHDQGTSGFFQLIPFYSIWMLFGEGNDSENRYGVNPKESNSTSSLKMATLFNTHLPKDKTYLEILNQMLSIILLNVLIVVILMTYLKKLEMVMYLCSLTSIIICYLLLLIISSNKERLPLEKMYIFKHRIIYATLLYLCLRLYMTYFLKVEFNLSNIFFEIFSIVIILSTTYVSNLLYPIYLKKVND